MKIITCAAILVLASCAPTRYAITLHAAASPGPVTRHDDPCKLVEASYDKVSKTSTALWECLTPLVKISVKEKIDVDTIT